MINWKTLMIFIYSWEADEAQEILNSNGISTISEIILMADPNHFDDVMGCAKLLIKEEDYKTGLQILRKSGFDHIQKITNGTYQEVDMSVYKSYV